MESRFWSELTRQLRPYTPGEQPRRADLLKLNTNECPYPPSPQVLRAVAAVTGEELLRYPDPDSRALRDELAAYYGLRSDQLFIGNGSDEVLSHLFLALLKHERELLFPDICYSFYPVWCQLHGISYRRVPLREDFSIAPEDYATDAAAVIFPNPNAPTGRYLPLERIREFLEASAGRLVVVDEAYVDFAPASAMQLIDDYDNLVVVQTLSKSRSLAGLRVGFAAGQAPLMEALVRVKDSFNSYPVDLLAQRAAAAAFADREWFAECVGKVCAAREQLQEGLAKLDFEVLPSAANFVFTRHSQLPGRVLFDGLRSRGILVRRWDQPRIEDYLRISVGTPEQVSRLLASLGDILREVA